MAPLPTDPPSDSAEGRWLELLTHGWREPGDLDATLERIAETAKKIFEADLCAIFALNPVIGRPPLENAVSGLSRRLMLA